MRTLLSISIAVLAPACSGAKAGESLAKTRSETLPNGVTRLMSEGPTAWAAGQPATLVEEVRFQGKDGTPSELGEPRDLAVDGQGRIYVVDGKPAAIKVFSPDGHFIRTIGRDGEGHPGGQVRGRGVRHRAVLRPFGALASRRLLTGSTIGPETTSETSAPST